MDRNTKFRIVAVACVLLASACTTGQARVIYVDDDANGVGDGLSWESPYKYLQDALADAESGDKPVEIRVARGAYKPDQGALLVPGDREAIFHLSDAVALVGGYAGFRAQFPEVRDVDRYETVLSGDLEGNDAHVAHARDLLTDPTRGDNSFCIVQVTGSRPSALFSAILDGFTVSSANGASALRVAACRPSIRDCTFANNASERCGAVYVDWASPDITNCKFRRNAAKGGAAIFTTQPRGGGSTFGGIIDGCTFEDNYVEEDGGAVRLAGGIGTIKNSVFKGNSAGNGGAVYCWGGDVVNCVFIGNSAVGQGGGYWTGGTSSVVNCLFACNSAREGGGVYFLSNRCPNITQSTFWANESVYGRAIAGSAGFGSLGPARITNTILRDGGDEIYITADQVKANTTATYSNIEGGWPGEGNVDVDPLFADPGYWDPNGTPEDPNDDFLVEGDCHLKSQAGRWDPISEGWVIDDLTSPCIDAGDPISPLGDEPFPHGGRINMGAYGGTAEASKSHSDAAVVQTHR